MVVLIDPPTWPAHGTVFSHLVSDVSLDELHTFATQHGVSGRAFDLDHYDVPAHLYDALVDGGAQPVSGSELTRRLVESGLRVPYKERPQKIRKTLLARWEVLAPGAGQLGEELLDCWQQPHRTYHNSAHLLEVLRHLQVIGEGKVPRAVLLAAWFHDAVYRGHPGADEAASAQCARKRLPHYGVTTPIEAEAVAQLVEATASHKTPVISQELSAADVTPHHVDLFFDADLAILAADEARYRRYAGGVRREYAHLPSAEFRRGRAAVLTGFLERPAIFSTVVARERFEVAARANIARELEELTAGL